MSVTDASRSDDASPSDWDEDGREPYVFEPNDRSMPNLRRYLQNMWERRAFIDALARSELKDKRAGTTLGPLWAVVDPLAQAGVYFLLFATIRSGSGRATAEQLPLLIFCIFIFRTMTAKAFNEAGNSISKGKGLLLNSTFPRMLLPISSVYKGVLDLGSTLALYAVIHIGFGLPISMSLLILPLILLINIALNVGIALTMSTLNVFIKDLSNMQSYMTRLLLFSSPIIYPVAMIPDSFRPILQLGPLFPFFAAYREVLTGSAPSPFYLLMASLWTVFFLIVGTKLFLSHERDFALHV